LFKFCEKLKKNRVLKWFIIGIPVLFGFGFIMHFIYKWSGESRIVGIFAPVNESVWEHLKLSFWPVNIWWASGFFIIRRKSKVSVSKWILSCAVAQLVCPLIILSFYYTYTGAFGTHSMILDILSLLLGLAAASALAYHVYKYAEPCRYCMYISIAILIILAVLFTVFTYKPPHIPLFKAPQSGK